MTKPLNDAKIAVVGAGLIGCAWAALFRHHGAKVAVWDPQEDALNTAPARIEAAGAQLAALHGAQADARPVQIADALDAALADADLAQENAPEDAALKRDLFERIEAAAPPTAILASSTSALTWSDIAPGLRAPERLITAHPFNPPHLVPLVEIYAVDDAAAQRAEALYAAAGRVPVRLRKDAPGHVANRLASALWREAAYMVEAGIADVSAIDAALVHGPGLRWAALGAHMAYHLGGGSGGMRGYLAHLGASQERRWVSLGAPSLTPELREAIAAGVEEEAAGRSIQALEEARDAALIALPVSYTHLTLPTNREV